MYLRKHSKMLVPFCLLLLLSHLVSAMANAIEGVPTKDAFIRAVPAKDKVYVGEPFTVSILLYHHIPIIDSQNEITTSFKDCFVEEYPFKELSWEEKVDGEPYNVILLKKYLLIPEREGTVTIPSVSRTIKINVPPAPDDFFGVEQIVSRKLISEVETVKVIPLPQPPDAAMFTQVVGKFKVLSKYELSDKSSRMLTFQLEVKGLGNMKPAKLLVPEMPEGIDLFNEDNVGEQSLTDSNLKAAHKFTFQLIAAYQGEYSVPPIAFVFLDPEKGTYEKYESPAYQWTVTEGPEKPDNLKANADKNSKDGEPALYIKSSLGSGAGKLFYGSALYYFVLVLSGLMFLFGILYTRYKKGEEADPALHLSKRAKKRALREITALEANYVHLEQDEFYKLLSEIIARYLSCKLYLDSKLLTVEDLELNLLEEQVPRALVKETVVLLQKLCTIRFAPTEVDLEGHVALCKLCKELIKNLEFHLHGKTVDKPVPAR